MSESSVSLNDCATAFEKWHRTHSHHDAGQLYSKGEIPADQVKQSMFMAWQAAWELQDARIVNISKISDILNTSAEHAQNLNTSRTLNLKPCPGCGNTDIRSYEESDYHGQVFCHKCGWNVQQKSKDEAEYLWNTRYQPSEIPSGTLIQEPAREIIVAGDEMAFLKMLRGAYHDAEAASATENKDNKGAEMAMQIIMDGWRGVLMAIKPYLREPSEISVDDAYWIEAVRHGLRNTPGSWGIEHRAGIIWDQWLKPALEKHIPKREVVKLPTKESTYHINLKQDLAGMKASGLALTDYFKRRQCDYMELLLSLIEDGSANG